jgi:O-antigen/teichoic acid export membrane protein
MNYRMPEILATPLPGDADIASGPAEASSVAPRPGGAARVAARGAALNYLAQLMTVGMQFGYAAVTSRLLEPVAFGAYGAALVIAGFVTVLAVAGLPQAVARLAELEPGRLSALLLYATGVGVVAAGFVALTGPFWSNLLGVPSAAPVLDVLAVNILCTPVLAVGTGVLLRRGRFLLLAALTFGTNVGGMAVGLLVVLATRAPAALAVAATVGQGAAALGCVLLSRHLLLRRPRGAHVLQDGLFTGRLTGSIAVSYTAANLGKIVVGAVLGAAALGRWNRGDVLTTVPFMQLQMALTQVLLPQFRHDERDPDRPLRVWADLLGLVAWVTLPSAAVLAAVVPVVVPVFFGEQWGSVALLIPLLAALGGVRTLVFVLVGALEVQERMRWVWAGHLVALGGAAVGGVLTLLGGGIAAVLWGAMAGLLLMHAVHVVLAARAGLLRRGALLRHYAGAAAASVLLAVAALLAVRWALTMPDVLLGVGVLLLTATVVLAAAWTCRGALPLFTIARRYGLLSR